MVLEPANIRSLLIRAWRERWTDMQWGIHIKTVLPRYISGDIYHLSDCILQQALMGMLPNHLILSYLKHSLSSQIVSYGGVFESISKYDGFSKPHCTHALLTLMHSMMRSVTCKGKPEDCLMLASSLVAAATWIVQVMSHSCDHLVDLQTAPEYTDSLSLACSILDEMLSSPFLMCMKDIGIREDQGLWIDCQKCLTKIESQVVGSPSVFENREKIISTVTQFRDESALRNLYDQVHYDSSAYPYCNAIQSLVMIEVVKHTTRDSKVLVQYLRLMQKFKGLTLTQLYLEILRSCFMGMSCQEMKQYQELKWVGFSYIKAPAIINAIHTEMMSHPNTSNCLYNALKMLSHQTSLLDVADYRIKCNCLEYLLKEFMHKQIQSDKPSLISEKDAQTILSTRIQNSNVLRNPSSGIPQPSGSANPDLILRAQPTVVSILTTLSNKNTDSVLTVLSLLISGKSRELLLIAAASSGTLHIYAQQFVKLNEQSKDPQPGETAKIATNRAVVFDISFLLLFHIAQIYGIDVVVSESCDTFVERWIKDNIPVPGRVKSAKRLINPESDAVDEFLGQMRSSEVEYVNCKWGDYCSVATVAMREAMSACRHGLVPKVKIFELLDKLCFHLCSLPICIAAWLSSHIQQVDSSEAKQSFEFFEYMQNKMTTNEPTQPLLDNFKDRSHLMGEIIENVVHVMKNFVYNSGGKESNEPSQFDNRGLGQFTSTPLPCHIQLKPTGLDSTPLWMLLKEKWPEYNGSGGMLTHEGLGLAREMLRLGGTKWFVMSFVKYTMDKVFEDDLARHVDMIYGLFHLDIVGCSLSYLINTLPQYISGPLSLDLLSEPRTSALARLTAMVFVSCWTAVQPSPEDISVDMTSPAKKGLKRSSSTRELEDLQERLSKQVFQMPFNTSSLGLGPEGQAFLKSVHALFRLMAQVVRSGVVSPVIHFVVFFLRDIVSLPHTPTLLSLLPPSLLSNLLPVLSSSAPLTFEPAQLLALTAPQGTGNIPGGLIPLPADATFLSQSQTKGQRMAAAKVLCNWRNTTIHTAMDEGA